MFTLSFFWKVLVFSCTKYQMAFATIVALNMETTF